MSEMRAPSDWEQEILDIVKTVAGLDEAGASLQHYVDRLHAWNQVHNLTGLAHHEQMVAQLLRPSIALAPVLKKYKTVLDLGTGAGIPGLVLAICHPWQSWILVERSQKKGRFLQQIITDLGCHNVTVRITDFTQMAYDKQIEAIVTRGSAKLKQQIAMTAAWRQQDVPLFSVQTKKSLFEQADSVSQADMQTVDGFDEPGLILLQVR